MAGVRNGNGKMGFQRTADCRSKKKTEEKKLKKKELDRIRYLKKKGQKVEAIKMEIKRKQSEINKAEGVIQDTLVQIEIKQLEVTTSKKELEKERRALRKVNALNKKS